MQKLTEKNQKKILLTRTVIINAVSYSIRI